MSSKIGERNVLPLPECGPVHWAILQEQPVAADLWQWPGNSSAEKLSRMYLLFFRYKTGTNQKNTLSTNI